MKWNLESKLWKIFLVIGKYKVDSTTWEQLNFPADPEKFTKSCAKRFKLSGWLSQKIVSYQQQEKNLVISATFAVRNQTYSAPQRKKILE